MKKFLFILCFLVSASQVAAETRILITTNLGLIEAILFDEQAPVSTRNFLNYVQKGFYEGTTFHRVIPGFMIQGGGFTTTLDKKSTDQPIDNEAGNGLKNERGTLAMARTAFVNSATSQFFINLVDNPFLDHRSKSQSGYGYAVFGKVLKGMEIVDKIGAVKTGKQKGMNDVPVSPVVIQSIQLLQ
ncbi:MAG: peptidyl-prolyl cis-trans isomerase [Desulfuromonadaceae bacterium]|nr:peptidyl-prolyl cis-trans isomerase [Desulfuromonadaceae bacterium]